MGTISPSASSARTGGGSAYDGGGGEQASEQAQEKLRERLVQYLEGQLRVEPSSRPKL
eukprot:SAG11_NODE_134_length_15338_cov_3.876435_5_plen_58_part_00